MIFLLLCICYVDTVLSFPVTTNSLVGQWKKTSSLSFFPNPFASSVEETSADETNRNDPQSILDSLQLESNLEPKRFTVESNQLFSIIGASFPVS